MGTVKKHLSISGQVQGVGFRYFTSKEASRKNLNGWVKNLPDGSVEVFLAGEEHKVEEMIKKLNDGPAAAVVESVNELPVTDTPEVSGFEIRRS